jgi:haloalkane dehalogenase
MRMDVLRTDDDAFSITIRRFPFPVRYVDVASGDGSGTIRMASYAAGPDSGPVTVLLHGEPTWSYLYRDVMARLAERGVRSVALDLVGFGRSDKPAAQADHSYARHVAWVREALESGLGLSDVTIVGQDWGGLIGLRLAIEAPDLVGSFVAANTGLPTGEHAMPEIWWMFRRAMESAEVLDIGRFVEAGCRAGLSDEDRSAYDAPFPLPALTAGPRAMPGLVPTSREDPAAAANQAAWRALSEYRRPFLVAFSDGDPITGAMGPRLRSHVPTADGEPDTVIADAGHFLQEDAGPQLADAVADFLDRHRGIGSRARQ